MDDWKIKLSYKSYLGQLKFCATSIKKFISHENKICHQTHPCHASLTSHCSKFTNVKTFLTLKLSQHLKSGSTFCSSVPVVALIDCQCCRLGNQSCRAAAPKDQPLISQSKPLIAFWNDLWDLTLAEPHFLFRNRRKSQFKCSVLGGFRARRWILK